jgi:uncharacterized membrane protein
MTKGRMEAFSDGVIAILITIMVLELKLPHSGDLSSLRPLLSDFGTYVLSFIFLGIYWNNHHHLLHAVKHVNGGVLWANLHLLFWLSLIPLTTSWMGENCFSKWPVAFYGMDLLLASIAYFILVRILLSIHSSDSTLAVALGSDLKGKLSTLLYAVAITLAFVKPWIACMFYIVVAIMWLIPDRRIERKLTE